MYLRCFVIGYIVCMVSMSAFSINHWHLNKIKKKYPRNFNPPPIIWSDVVITKSDLFGQIATQENHLEMSEKLFKMLTGNYVCRLMNIMNIIKKLAEVNQQLSSEEVYKGRLALNNAFIKFEESLYLIDIDTKKYSEKAPAVITWIFENIETVKKNLFPAFVTITFSNYIEWCNVFFRGEYYLEGYDLLMISKKIIFNAEYLVSGVRKNEGYTCLELNIGVSEIKKKIVEDIKIRNHQL